jgi:DNA-binding response OmpR family regulator
VWILVIGREGLEDREGSAVACLHELGCEVQTANLWDRLDTEELISNPPAAVLIEAGEEADAGRAALVRVRAAEPLQEVPVLIGVTLNALSRLDAGDGFDDFALMPYVPAELYMRIRRIEWSRSDFARGRVFSRRQLLERVWGVDYYGSSRTVDIHVRRLRMKLGHSVNNLETVRGVGYKMKEP